ncbi:hypothetical protein DRJ00_05745 [Candidatus Aerophobetes bacterium]|uniref:Solute-binding protein family 5 domain-containing protein n=1 Tax=Aerophobetes bacterium TaxID=2030807 RepID=A0A497E2Z6_UNCAE|nr:MAG: hypothetical protein DRJ00_05745 [Candidatus Aerophobetes bacterium]
MFKIMYEEAKMVRKLMVLVLSGVITIWLWGSTPALAKGSSSTLYQEGATIYGTLQEYEKTTGRKIEKFGEAPTLRVKVAAGELPPVKERLPERPLVMKPIEEIGQYGGTIKIVSVSSTWSRMVSSRMETLLISRPGRTLPGIAESWEWSDEKKVLTLHLRKGLKWSDGYPFTVDDILFKWEDITLNPTLNPTVLVEWKPGGELMQMEKVDDYTLRFRFAVPYPQMTDLLANCAYGGDCPFHVVGIYAPKHYLKKFHIKYNPKADELAKEAGFNTWWEYFNHQHNPYYGVNYPTLSAWICTKATDTLRVYERNPYYWVIDSAGNQLPYIDKGIVQIVGNIDLYNMKIISGAADFANQYTSMKNYPLYKRNEAKGDYRVLRWVIPGGRVTFTFNQTSEDPVKRQIFQDIRFRQAMSLAIDREALNKSLYFGLATPCQCMPIHKGALCWQEWWKDYYAEYDPKKANQLLDEMGLDKRDEEGYRLRPDGKRLTIILNPFELQDVPEMTAVCEMVKEYWENVGVKVLIKPISSNLYGNLEKANKLDVAIWKKGGGLVDEPEEKSFFATAAYEVYPSQYSPWGKWIATNGKEGEKPPEWVLKIKELCDKGRQTTLGTEEYKQLSTEVCNLWMKHLPRIGTVCDIFRPTLVKKNLRNVPEKSKDYGNDMMRNTPQTFFFKK